ncbi:hypothetical protein [Tenacibaculum sp. IB213877]|uniref:hypothetical protein n=1 Tax=Tenacibaculum sp. IB213877 TaxID=3097351 RepID=UPI002A59CEE2|nr:hypothetical protein [Tenacibaculum sp. IB213877]MDY0779816.1 hypothetical protein [Tenacibaculum sp. IB213877]
MIKNINIILKILVLTSALALSYKANAQEVNVVTNKGTLTTVKNTRVFTGTKPLNADALIGDMFFDVYPNPTTIEIWEGSEWRKINNNSSHTGTTGSVFFANTDGTPTENNTALNFNNTNSTLNSSNISITGTYADSDGDVGINGQILSSTATGTNWINNVAANNWLITGNSNATAANFLGTTNDVRMQIRSNNLPMLEFGRRQTLGLTTGNPDYNNPDQPLVHLNGNGTTAALQFASASGAYKPMFFTTTNGAFRLRGNMSTNDLFEFGSAGPNNDGRLEFIVGDDNTEPIVFKRHFWDGDMQTEFFRVQGHQYGINAKTRFGININPTPVAKDDTYNDASTGTSNTQMANSTFQVKGSISKSILTTTGNLTLTEDHYSIMLGGAHTITLPNANTCEGRIYIIKNPFNVDTSISSFVGVDNTNKNLVPKESVLWIQSNSSNWQQINNNKTSSGTSSSSGDIKHGVQNADHSGWYILDGRPISSLSPSAQAAASSLGFSTNLPNANNRVLKHPDSSQSIGDVGGQASTVLIQNNLPNVNFFGNTSTTGNHNHNFTGVIATGRMLNNSDSNVSVYTQDIAGSTNTSTNGNHSHAVTVNSGGNSQSFERYQPFLVVNTFIYLGL